MRTIQVRAICNRCQKVEFYDMPIKLDYKNRVVGDPGGSIFSGPPGWRMFLSECYCSAECQDYVKIVSDPSLFKFKPHQYKELTEYNYLNDAIVK